MSKRKRGAQPPPQREATAADPTKQRLAKQPEVFDDDGVAIDPWERTNWAGGQTSHRAKPVLEMVRDQIQDAEWTALTQFTDLAEQALRVGDTICGRTYTGMPYASNASRDNGDSAAKRSAAYAKFEGILLQMVDELFVTTAFAMVLGIRKEAGGEPLSLEEFGASLMRWRDKPTHKGGALLAIRATARVVMYAQKRWETQARSDRRDRSAVQEAFEHGRKVERYEQREALLRRVNMRDQVESHFKQQRANGRVRA